jgi:hypothetical protein
MEREMKQGLLIAVLLLTGATSAIAQVVAPPPPPPAPVTQPAKPAAPAVTPGVPVDYVFPSGAGLLIFHVDPLKVADFDAILARIKDALSKADTATRKVQAANWLIYKSAEKPAESVVYLFLFDPAVANADYNPLLVLAEILPAEVQNIYERMKTAVLRIERMGLTKIR